jgi:hypothetical protein
MSLGALDAVFHGRYPQFVVLHAQQNFVARIDAERFAKGSRDHHPSVFINPQPGFGIHVTPLHI